MFFENRGKATEIKNNGEINCYTTDTFQNHNIFSWNTEICLYAD